MEKITYASLGSLGEEFHSQFDAALSKLTRTFGKTHSLLIDGKLEKGKETFGDISPSDTRVVLGNFPLATVDDVMKAIAAAKRAYPPWRDLDWQKRVALLRRAADLMMQRQFELAAILTLEVGKNRFEAIAEVSEAIDLILYYAQQMENNDGYNIPLVTTGAEQTRSVLKPFGVWAVVSPFNFPLALATGMAAGALLSGNTVVFKPASDTPWSGVGLATVMHDAGLPAGVFNLVTGSGAVVGETLLTNGDLDGFVFTGSREVGLKVLRDFSARSPKPRITEMGGKNPTIVMPSASLEDAAEGIVRSAFGMGGQKCSACSRLYAHADIYDALAEMMVPKTKKLKIGDPRERDTFLGPLINERAVKTFNSAVQLGRTEGRVLCGGNVLQDGARAHGYFVEPTIIDALPQDSRMFQEEFFVPLLSMAKVHSLDEAIRLANDVEYGLTSGIFTNDETEHAQFFNEIEAGVTYCNRRGGATTGAWPGVQSFGGWKASGSSGKSALGPYYVSQFMREQSQTIVYKR
ncbi:MAG: Aldehyde Dehydrogenase [Verrucomicrobiales bacterium]|nr:Aldehyde Dehydrogenase [Verrucomicrobiales bacterium]